MADRIVYKHIVTFQDVLDNAPTEIKERFDSLSEEEKEEFIEDNIADCARGFDWGLSDPNSDAIQTVAANLVFKEKKQLKLNKMKVYIDNSRFLEAISTVADQIVEAQFGVGFDKEDDGEGGTRYTEEAQDLFNEKYDAIESLFNSTLGIYSSNDLEDADGRN